MKSVLRVLIDTDGAYCGNACRFLDNVVDSCTLFGRLEFTPSAPYARPHNCVKAGVAASPSDLRNVVRAGPGLVRARRR